MNETVTSLARVLTIVGAFPGVTLIVAGVLAHLVALDPSEIALERKVSISVGIGWVILVLFASFLSSGILKNCIVSVFAFWEKLTSTQREQTSVVSVAGR